MSFYTWWHVIKMPHGLLCGYEISPVCLCTFWLSLLTYSDVFEVYTDIKLHFRSQFATQLFVCCLCLISDKGKTKWSFKGFFFSHFHDEFPQFIVLNRLTERGNMTAVTITVKSIMIKQLEQHHNNLWRIRSDKELLTVLQSYSSFLL